ncbi:MAG: tetratricopeptide repeat protein [Desulfobulbus sp.]|nr:tetratricopeptide repeat protein [Desulfobulbus sp.]
MDTTGYVKKQSLYLAILAALILGFIAGVAYSVYRAPAGGAPQVADQQHAAEVIASLEKATKQNPNDAATWIQLGHAYFDSGQAQNAIAVYTKALELQPGDVNVMTDLGVMYHQDKQHQKAIDLFDRVLAINPEHEQARFNKGVVLLTGLDDRKAAIAEWKILVKFHPMAATPSGKMVGDLIDQLEKADDK